MLNFSADIGGSETRVSEPLLGSLVVDSPMLVLSPTTQIKDMVQDKYSTCVIEHKGTKSLLIKGESLNYYKAVPQTCDNNTLKVDYLGTYYNLAYGIARLALSRRFVTGKIAVCIPPAEAFSDAKKTFVEQFSGDIKVEFPLTGESVILCFDKTDVIVLAEGAAAVFAVSDKGLQKKLKSSSMLIIDIGYRSTDFILLRNGMPYRGAYDSKPIGGINMEAAISSLLETQGIFKEGDDIRNVLCNGELYIGSSRKGVGSMVQQVKQQFADRLKQEAISILNAAGLNLAAINCFFPVGRPWNQTGEVGAANYADSLIGILEGILGVEAILKSPEEYTNIAGLQNILNDLANRNS